MAPSTELEFYSRHVQETNPTSQFDLKDIQLCAFHRISSLLEKHCKFLRWMMRQFHTRMHQRLSSVMAFTLATRGGTNARVITCHFMSLQFGFSLLLLGVARFLCCATQFLSGFKLQIRLSTRVSLVIRGEGARVQISS